ncbi:bis(5'-nucleosyl)-tetraphosphatase PrpE [Halalkalibacterium ligniniphilum]|uniref:bis(5'-nucleosyl)-tetraphosphatase PrpE n=1 Tax=Halalkalibacterium ligniniphilum TaxID=1134413 RepID=UPI00034BE40B|nr:bis(5'-nucleosyl)-tetraphosphatase PrpE [Halalkalibacterium ligniniphilum]
MELDIIGDIHGCYQELLALINELGYESKGDLFIHPHGRKLAFVGDLTDRGPQSLEVIRFVVSHVNAQLAYYVPGNHCNKLYRYLIGRNVQIQHGLETTVAELNDLTPSARKEVSQRFIDLYESAPLYHLLDNCKLVIAHAGILEADIGQRNKRVKTFVLYGDITGETNPDGTPVRRDWAASYKGQPWIVYGHTPVFEPRFKNRTVNIDTGCVFGGKLTGLRYPELTTLSIPSSLPYVSEKFRNFDS